MSSQSEASKENLGFITWMQMICCALVIFGHSYPFVTDIPKIMLNLRTFIYDFHMPVFVWCSGYLLIAAKQSEKYSFPTYLKHRTIHIILPYFAFSLIGIVPKVLLSSILNDGLSLDVIEIIIAFLVPRESIWGHFWFLPMIFVLGVIGYIIARFLKSGGVRILFAVLLLISVFGCFVPKITGWFAIDDIINFAFYYLLGMGCALWIPDFVKCDRKFCFVVGAVGLIASAILSVLLPHTELLGFIISLFMLSSVWIFSVVVAKKRTVGRQSIFAQTYSIFILSWPCQLVANVLFERFLRLPFVLVFISMLITGLAVPIVIIKLVDMLNKRINIKLILRMIGR